MALAIAGALLPVASCQREGIVATEMAALTSASAQHEHAPARVYVTLERSMLRAAVDETAAFHRCSRSTVVRRGGEAHGVRLRCGRLPRLMELLRLENEDVLVSISGASVVGGLPAIQTYHLEAVSDFDVELERRGQSLRMHYQVR